MNISESGLNLIKCFEGLRLRAYQCSVNVWTIGYGHTASVRPGDEITAEEADTFLRQDVSDAECTVNRNICVPINQNQFDALVSFVFNLGSGNFRTSTLPSVAALCPGSYPGMAYESAARSAVVECRSDL